MKILFVTGAMPPIACGVGDYTRHLAHALRAISDVEIEFLTSHCADRATGLGPVHAEVQDWRFGDLKRVVSAIRRVQPDVVHFQYPAQGYGVNWFPSFVPLIARLCGAHVVRTWHGVPSLRDSPRFVIQALAPGRFIFVHPQGVQSIPFTLTALGVHRRATFIPNAPAIPRSTTSSEARAALRKQYAGDAQRLLVFFGFLYPHKGAERLFEVAEPATDRIVFAGPLDEADDYQRAILRMADAPQWKGKVTFTGFLPAEQIADLLAAADCVMLPFRVGSGVWNTSVQAATQQGTFVLTTSVDRSAYDSEANIFYSHPDDTRAMKTALQAYSGRKQAVSPGSLPDWTGIAREHMAVYRSLLIHANAGESE